MIFLVVDDSKISRLYTKKCIKMITQGSDIDINIVEKVNGQEALELLTSEQVDIVISDLNMPVMTGSEMVKQMQSDQNLVKIPVIFVSSLASDARIDELIEIGAVAVIPKPLETNALKEAFSNLEITKQFIQEEEEGGWGA